MAWFRGARPRAAADSNTHATNATNTYTSEQNQRASAARAVTERTEPWNRTTERAPRKPSPSERNHRRPQSEPSGKPPGTPSNRTAEAMRASRRSAVGHAWNDPPKRYERAVGQAARHAVEPNRRASRRAATGHVSNDSRSVRSAKRHRRAVTHAEYRTEPLRLCRCVSLNGGRY
jgi:hypothetical protein